MIHNMCDCRCRDILLRGNSDTSAESSTEDEEATVPATPNIIEQDGQMQKDDELISPGSDVQASNNSLMQAEAQNEKEERLLFGSEADLIGCYDIGDSKEVYSKEWSNSRTEATSLVHLMTHTPLPLCRMHAIQSEDATMPTQKL